MGKLGKPDRYDSDAHKSGVQESGAHGSGKEHPIKRTNKGDTADLNKHSMKKAAAVKYDPEKSSAPLLTAKGSGYIADKIIARAAENGVYIKEDPDLVQALSTLDIYQEIPEQLYAVMAELLAEVYRINRLKGK